MIIKTDLTELISSKQFTKNTYKSQIVQKQPVRYSSTINKVQPVAKHIVQEKTLGEALSIAQTSQSVLMKAIEISTRLKNIANEAINTGTLNKDEVNIALSNINNTISQYGKQVSSPIQIFSNTKVDFPYHEDITNSLQNIKTIAQKINQNNFETQSLNNNDKILEDNLITVNNSINGITNSLNNLYNQFTNNIENTELTMNTLQHQIVNQSNNLLSTQGNINPETTQRLLE